VQHTRFRFAPTLLPSPTCLNDMPRLGSPASKNIVHIHIWVKHDHLRLSPPPSSIPSAYITIPFLRVTSCFATSRFRVKVLHRSSTLVTCPIRPPYWPFKTNTWLRGQGRAINRIGHAPSTFNTAASRNDTSFLMGSSLTCRITSCPHLLAPTYLLPL
jgi:hypothetical protein